MIYGNSLELISFVIARVQLDFEKNSGIRHVIARFENMTSWL